MKKKIYIFIIVVLVVLLSVGGYFAYKKIQNNNLLKEINSHYDKHIIVSKNSKLFDKDKNVIGKVNEDIAFVLNDYVIDDISKQYFNVANTKFYVYYDDVKPIKTINDETINDNYLTFNQNIETDDKTIFYKDNKAIFEINDKMSFPIEYMDESFYYVKYLNRVFQIKKDDNANVVDNKNTELNESSYVSVLHFDTIYEKEKCQKLTCIKLDTLKKYVDYLDKEGYYSITFDEYEDYLDKKIHLKEKAILLTVGNSNDTLIKYNEEAEYKFNLIDKESNLKFKDTNKKTTVESNKNALNRYVIKTSTTMDNFKKMVAGKNVVEYVYVNEQKIPVLNYHFFYDSTLGESCNESICLDVKNFREQLTYLKDNGYKTLTMDEFTKWMYRQIELPKKSVLITIDDGAMGTGKHNGNKLIPILEEFNMNATLFLISGWWDVNNYRSSRLDIQSHTYDMHKYGSCGSGQAVCNSKASVLADLKKSLTIVDNNNSFCFPFYSYSDLAVEAVKEAGFKLAFIGGNRKAGRSDNKYLIPRYPIYKNTSLERFKNIVG